MTKNEQILRPTDTKVAPTELVDVGAVRDRYRISGPHATATFEVSKPGTFGDNVTARWHSARHQLECDGAPEPVLRQLDWAVSSLAPKGGVALVSANTDSSAVAWLTTDPGRPSTAVGETPHLLRVLDEVVANPPVVGAIVDRIGADVFSFEASTRSELVAVDGPSERVHRSQVGGWSQNPQQRRVEEQWRKNASVVAEKIVSLARATDATMVVLTGDDHACALVENEIDIDLFRVVRVHAGSRHDSNGPQRLELAVRRARIQHHREVVQEEADHLFDELPDRSHAVAGLRAAKEAIEQGKAATLFVASDEALTENEIDVIVGAALMRGAAVFAVADLHGHEVAARLRRR
ncbi:MAG: hypothetical protein ACI9OJ_004616 [Myxococcota bacterium]|jgi:hypothetical protein